MKNLQYNRPSLNLRHEIDGIRHAASVARFMEQGIEIPFPQLDVRFKGGACR
jgi:hypothetical protein